MKYIICRRDESGLLIPEGPFNTLREAEVKLQQNYENDLKYYDDNVRDSNFSMFGNGYTIELVDCGSYTVEQHIFSVRD